MVSPPIFKKDQPSNQNNDEGKREENGAAKSVSKTSTAAAKSGKDDDGVKKLNNSVATPKEPGKSPGANLGTIKDVSSKTKEAPSSNAQTADTKKSEQDSPQAKASARPKEKSKPNQTNREAAATASGPLGVVGTNALPSETRPNSTAQKAPVATVESTHGQVQQNPMLYRPGAISQIPTVPQPTKRKRYKPGEPRPKAGRPKKVDRDTITMENQRVEIQPARLMHIQPSPLAMPTHPGAPLMHGRPHSNAVEARAIATPYLQGLAPATPLPPYLEPFPVPQSFRLRNSGDAAQQEKNRHGEKWRCKGFSKDFAAPFVNLTLRHYMETYVDPVIFMQMIRRPFTLDFCFGPSHYIEFDAMGEPTLRAQHCQRDKIFDGKNSRRRMCADCSKTGQYLKSIMAELTIYLEEKKEFAKDPSKGMPCLDHLTENMKMIAGKKDLLQLVSNLRASRYDLKEELDMLKRKDKKRTIADSDAKEYLKAKRGKQMEELRELEKMVLKQQRSPTNRVFRGMSGMDFVKLNSPDEQFVFPRESQINAAKAKQAAEKRKKPPTKNEQPPAKQSPANLAKFAEMRKKAIDGMRKRAAASAPRNESGEKRKKRAKDQPTMPNQNLPPPFAVQPYMSPYSPHFQNYFKMQRPMWPQYFPPVAAVHGPNPPPPVATDGQEKKNEIFASAKDQSSATKTPVQTGEPRPQTATAGASSSQTDVLAKATEQVATTGTPGESSEKGREPKQVEREVQVEPKVATTGTPSEFSEKGSITQQVEPEVKTEETSKSN